MKRFIVTGLAMLCVAGPALLVTAQTATAPAGQTPQQGTPGAAAQRTNSTGGAQAPGTANPGTPTTPGSSVGGAPVQNGSGAQARRGGTRRGARKGGAPAASNAPVGNSRVVVFGGDSQIGKPSLDHPMLPMTTVGNALGIRSGTPIHVELAQRADSGHVRNGDTLHGTLTAPIAGLPAGTPVQLTVVQASPAGTLTSAGELSIQVTRIADHSVLSVIVTALGREGKKEIADAAPGVGTEAEFAGGQDLSFPAS